MIEEFQKQSKTDSFLSSEGGITGVALKGVLGRAAYCTESELNSVGGSASPFAQSVALQTALLADRQKNPFIPELEKRVTAQEVAKRCHNKLDTAIKVNTLFDDGISHQTGTSLKRGQMAEKIRKALTQNNVVGIGYHVNFMMDQTLPSGQDRHASSITGMQMLNGKCHYMLRNSWGDNCDAYKAEYKGLCKKGIIYLPEEEMLKNIYRSETIEQKNSEDVEQKLPDVKDSTQVET